MPGFAKKASVKLDPNPKGAVNVLLRASDNSLGDVEARLAITVNGIRLVKTKGRDEVREKIKQNFPQICAEIVRPKRWKASLEDNKNVRSLVHTNIVFVSLVTICDNRVFAISDQPLGS